MNTRRRFLKGLIGAAVGAPFVFGKAERPWTPKLPQPFPEQAKVLASNARIRFAMSGPRGGKTRLGIFAINQELERNPRARILVVTPSYAMGKHVTFQQVKRLCSKGSIQYGWDTDRAIIDDPDDMFSLWFKSEGEERAIAHIPEGDWDFVFCDEFSLMRKMWIWRHLDDRARRILFVGTIERRHDTILDQVGNYWPIERQDHSAWWWSLTCNPYLDPGYAAKSSTIFEQNRPASGEFICWEHPYYEYHGKEWL